MSADSPVNHLLRNRRYLPTPAASDPGARRLKGPNR